MRREVLQRAFGRLGAAEEQWIFLAFAVIALVSAAVVYWYMRREMR